MKMYDYYKKFNEEFGNSGNAVRESEVKTLLALAKVNEAAAAEITNKLIKENKIPNYGSLIE